jgi:hypothetical protein
MTVYRISKPAFWAIFALILALPVGRHWRLLATGERTTAEILQYEHYYKGTAFGRDYEVWANRIRFPAGDSLVELHTRTDAELDPGDTYTVYYSAEDPARYCMLCFEDLYLSSYSILVFVLLMLWGAFYLSFNNYVKKQRFDRVPGAGRKGAQHGGSGRKGVHRGGHGRMDDGGRRASLNGGRDIADKRAGS